MPDEDNSKVIKVDGEVHTKIKLEAVRHQVTIAHLSKLILEDGIDRIHRGDLVIQPAVSESTAGFAQ